MSGAITSVNCTVTSNSGGVLIASNIALSVVTGLIAITSVLSNGLVIACVAKTPRLQHPAILMLCSLSLSDLLAGVTAMPFFAASRLVLVRGSVNMCLYETFLNVYGFSMSVFSGASFVQLCLLSWDRYKAVSNPSGYCQSNESKRKTLTVIAITWFAWIAVAILLRLSPQSPRRYCKALIGAFFLMFLVAMQVATYKAIRLHNREMVGTESQATAVEVLAREKKVFTTVRYVLAALVITLAVPLVVFVSMICTKAVISGQSHIMAWANVCLFVNSLINPIVYFLRHADMRTAAFGLIGY